MNLCGAGLAAGAAADCHGKQWNEAASQDDDKQGPGIAEHGDEGRRNLSGRPGAT
jgi:hypothetical protein